MPLSDLEKIIREVCSMEDSKEIHLMLDFYHDLGVIVKHGDTVVLDTQWLIDLFRKLIIVRPYDDQNPMFDKCWKDLEENGILRMELVDHVFSDLLDSGQSKEDLLDMMEHYGLIAVFNKVGDTKEACYFVPAQLQSAPGTLLDTQPSPRGPCELYVCFDNGFVPHGLYTLLVSKCIVCCSEDGNPKKPNLFRNASRYFVGKSSDYQLVIICRKHYIKAILCSTSQANKSYFNETAVSVRIFIESALKKISEECQWYRSLSYQLYVKCPSCSKSSKPIHLLKVEVPRHLMVCDKSYGNDAQPEVKNLELWYSTPKPVEGVLPRTAASPEGQIPTSLSRKEVTSDMLNKLNLAEKISITWKVLGRILNLKDHHINNIDDTYKETEEKSSQMLIKWRESSGDPSVGALWTALKNVGRKDLAAEVEDYCKKTTFPEMADLGRDLPVIEQPVRGNQAQSAEHGVLDQQPQEQFRERHETDCVVPYRPNVEQSVEAVLARTAAFPEGQALNINYHVINISGGQVAVGENATINSNNALSLPELEPSSSSPSDVSRPITYFAVQEETDSSGSKS